MPFEVTDINFNVTSHSLGHILDEKKDSLIILPVNFTDEGEFYFRAEGKNLIKYADSQGIKVFESKEEDFRPKYILTESIEWIGPIIFLSSSFLAQNPEGVSIALNLISSYLYDFFRGDRDQVKCEFELVIQKTETEFKSLKYKGEKLSSEDMQGIIKAFKHE